jgi:hypothetical protein
MEQGWYNLLFAHWEVPLAQLRALVPHALELDTYTGSAWVSITPFRLSIRPRGLAVAGRLWSFPEMNFRTYVHYRGKPGIYFFSLDAANLLAVAGARLFYHLPYFHALMDIRPDGDGFRYRSRRMHSSMEFSARYEAISDAYNAAPGTLSHWLSERYCLYALDGTKVKRAEIHHPPWSLQNARADIATNTLPHQAGLSLAATPDLLHFSAALEVLVWPLRLA